MMNHEDVWRAIDGLASKMGMSPSALARTSGLDPTTFNKSKRYAADGRPRWPSTESIAKVLRATDTSITELFGPPALEFDDTKGLTVPLVGAAHAGVKYSSVEHPMPTPARIINFPDRRYEPMFAVHVVGDAMLPFYRDGDILFTTTACPPHEGDRIVMKLTSGEVLVGIFRRFNGVTYELQALSPGQTDAFIDARDVESVAKVVYATQ